MMDCQAEKAGRIIRAEMVQIPLEILALLLSVVSVIIAFHAYLRSGKALGISEDANDLSKEANEIAKRQLSHETVRAELLLPRLNFHVSLNIVDQGRIWNVVTEISNTGGYPTEIVKGYVWLKSIQQPNEEDADKLDGIKIAGGG